VAHQTEEQGQLFLLTVLLDECMNGEQLAGSLERLTKDLSKYLIYPYLLYIYFFFILTNYFLFMYLFFIFVFI